MNVLEDDAADVLSAEASGRHEIAGSAHKPDEIFVVDDDPAIRALLTMLLSRQRFNVTGFAEGGSLLMALRTKCPLCILLDVHIPGKSGLDILKEIKNRELNVPVFIISGHGDISMAVDAIKNGALDFLKNPSAVRTSSPACATGYLPKPNEARQPKVHLTFFQVARR